MRTSSTLRRSIAVLATTGLLSGGLSALSAPAWAVYPSAAVITKISPSSWDNRSSVTVTVTGSSFGPNDSVLLQPACSDDPTAVVPSGAPRAPVTRAGVGEPS